jgi:DNA-binding transcriptional LysR family regulator
MLDDILLFVKVVDAGSILAAEKILNIPKSTISRKMQALEEEFGDALFNRSTHKIGLTMLGHNIYTKFKDYENKLSEMLVSVKNNTKDVRGRLNVLLPFALTVDVVLARMGEFLKKYPELQLNVMHSFQVFNMHKEFYDIAVINYQPKQQGQRFKSLASDKVIVVCSPEYIEKNGEFSDVNDTGEHVVVGKIAPDGVAIQEIPIFNEKTAEIHIVKVKPKVFLSNFDECKNFVLHHNGIAGIPLSLVREEINSGKLIRLIPDWHGGIINYYVMRNIPDNDPRYIVFLKFIQECLKDIGLDKINVNPNQFFHA